MTYRVLGYQHISYVNKSGRPVVGTRLYCACDDLQVQGVKAEPYFYSGSHITPSIGDDYNLEFNSDGRLVSVSQL